MVPPIQTHALKDFVDRIALMVTELNGLSSIIVNEEVTPADLADDLTGLEYQLAQVEEAVSQLAAVFEAKVPQSVFTVVAIEHITCRVWYEVTDVDSVAAAIAAYQQGDRRETERTIVSIDASKVADAWQEV